MRFGRYILFLGFLLIIFSSWILSYVSQDREKSEFENRFLAQSPKVSSQKIESGEYFKQFLRKRTLLISFISVITGLSIMPNCK